MARQQLTETTRAVQAPEMAEQRLVSLPKPRVPAGQDELPVTEADGGRATS